MKFMGAWPRIFAGFLLLSLALPAHAQDVFSSGGNGGGDVFSGGGGYSGGNDDFGGDSGPGGRPQPASQNGCDPWFGYQNYLRSELQHLGPYCQISGNVLLCRQMHPNMCNAELSTRGEWAMVDTGMRVSPDCHLVCAQRSGDGWPSSAPPAAQGPANGVPECNGLPPAMQARVRYDANETLNTLAGMGAQTDNLLNHFGNAAMANFNGLLHPDQMAAGWQKGYQSAVDFLANQDPNKWNALRDKAIADAKADPSGLIGDVAGNMFAGKMIGGACKVTTAAGRTLLGKVATAERASGSLRGVVRDMRRVENPDGTIPVTNDRPGTGGPSGQRKPPLIGKAGDPISTNPFYNGNNCVPATIAGLLKAVDKRPWTDIDVVQRYPRGPEVMKYLSKDLPLPGPLTFDMMRYYFGNITPRGLPAARIIDQAFGVPTQMSKRAIEQELLQGGAGSSGMVFVQFYENGALKQHVFQARNVDGAVQFLDNQSGLPGDYNFNGIVGSSFYRAR